MNKYVKIIVPIAIVVVILVIVILVINSSNNSDGVNNNENTVDIYNLYLKNENYKEDTRKTNDDSYLLADGYEAYSKEFSFYNKKAKMIYFRYNENSDFSGLIKNTIKLELCDIESDLESEINNFNKYCTSTVNYDGELISSVYFKSEANNDDHYTNLKNDKIVYYHIFMHNDKYYEISYYNENNKLIGEFSYNGSNGNSNNKIKKDSVGEH